VEPKFNSTLQCELAMVEVDYDTVLELAPCQVSSICECWGAGVERTISQGCRKGGVQRMSWT